MLVSIISALDAGSNYAVMHLHQGQLHSLVTPAYSVGWLSSHMNVRGTRPELRKKGEKPITSDLAQLNANLIAGKR